MDNNKPTIQANPGNVSGGKTVAQNAATKEAELNEPYLDKRTVTIAPVQLFSAYRNANKASIGPRKTVIGSSINSSRILSSNKGEVEAYFPELIGISPSHQEFTSHVKAYLNNISFNVNEKGTPLNISSSSSSSSSSNPFSSLFSFFLSSNFAFKLSGNKNSPI